MYFEIEPLHTRSRQKKRHMSMAFRKRSSITSKGCYMGRVVEPAADPRWIDLLGLSLSWGIHELVGNAFITFRRYLAMILTYGIIALEESLRTARGRGQPIERDSEGLPMNLRLPPTEASIYTFALGPSLSNGISTLTTNCGREYDSPPRELLEEVTTLPMIRDTYSQTSDSSGSSSTIKEVAPCGGKQSAFKEVVLL